MTSIVSVICYLDLHFEGLTQFSKLVRTWEAGVGTPITDFVIFCLYVST